MILVTVGTQLPFDRLVLAVDAWAAKHPKLEFFAQVGPGATPPRHMPHADFVSPAKAESLIRDSELVVAHAGMGSVLTALGARRPILVMPRKAALGEHRNDHQLATARWLGGRPGVSVAWDETEVPIMLDARATLVAGAPIPPYADDAFIARLRAVVLDALGRRG